MADGGVPSLDLNLHERQSEAYLSLATEILYGGAAGGGKSHLLRVLAISICADVAGVQVYLFRRLSDDLFKNHMTGPGGFYELLGPWFQSGLVKYNAGKNFLEFWNSSRIWLCHCQYEKDVAKYQGAEIHVLLIDELTHFTKTIYAALRGRCRVGGLKVPARWKDRLPLIVCGANPGGIGHNWVKASWVSPKVAMDIWRAEKMDGGMLRQFIPALLADNPTMAANDPDYASRLMGLGNPALVEAMLNGNWDIVAGGAFDDVWGPRIILPRFRVPKWWSLDRVHDWGSSKPFANLWFAEADGTEVKIPHPTDIGQVLTFAPPRGSLIVFHEWYGCKLGEPNIGLKMPPREVGKRVLQIEADLQRQGWINAPVKPGPADNSIQSTIVPGVPTIASEMLLEQCYWTASDKSPGSRKTGLELTRARLMESGKDRPENPGLWVMNHCRHLIAHIPVLPRDPNNPDDIDTEAEDHDYDALRYRILAQRLEARTQKLEIGV